MTDTHQGPVVVGIDVMNNNGPVLTWAVREAEARRLPLRVVHAYGPVVANPWAPATYERTEIEVLRQAAEDVVRKAVGQVHALSPELSVAGAVVEGDARHVLIAESATSPVTAVGSRQLASMGATLLGSVGCGVSAGARGPIVVVRGPSGSQHARGLGARGDVLAPRPAGSDAVASGAARPAAC